MQLTNPISFQPLFFDRVWGGRHLHRLYNKALPPDIPIGESWELVDREDAQSIVQSGPLDGITLHELWEKHRDTVFGCKSDAARFPLLIKILDAREKLSVQVHPPADVAPELGGEPKTEMWYVADASPESDLYAGLRKGVTREDFALALENGTVAELIHRIPTHAGATMFIPSGRIHAIGAGNVIIEVQQNSDTTYRVFDWNRTGLDGKPRTLHIEESMRSINFEDFEPTLEPTDRECLVSNPLFRVEQWELTKERSATDSAAFAIFCVVRGRAQCGECQFTAGEFFLVPACMSDARIAPLEPGSLVLRTTLPSPAICSQK